LWAAFLVLTIVGERLELSRLTAPQAASKYFFFCASVYFGGIIWASIDHLRGLQMAGAGMFFLTLWLVRYDVARRTVRIPGLPRSSPCICWLATLAGGCCCLLDASRSAFREFRVAGISI
jgi:hypothetical protein